MTQDEQQQVNAMMRFYERQCGNPASEGAQAVGMAEALAIKLKAAQEELGALKKKYAPTDNVVPISEPVPPQGEPA